MRFHVHETSPWHSILREGEGEGGGSGGQSGVEGGGGEGEGNGAFVFDAGKAFEGLEADNLEWLQKANLRDDPKALAKHAHNQEKLLGNAIRVPGKDATPEERDAFLNKLGRPAKADDYQLAAPKELPEGLPYDGELATAFKGKAHELGLTAAQAAGLHDMFVAYNVNAYTAAVEGSVEQLKGKAQTATETLTKLWGPLDGDTAKANFAIADRVFALAPSGTEVLEELKGLGLVGPNKEILSAPIAKMLASIGNALYAEDSVLRGNPQAVGNPFKDGDDFNLTAAMAAVKADPDNARSLIAAAGKKPAEFGL